MKKYVMSASIAFSFAIAFAASSPSARATSPRYFEIYRSELTRFDIDPQLVGAQNTASGSVAFNVTTNELTLRLDQVMDCPAGAACALVMPYEQIVRLPLVSVTYDRCGTRVLTALTDFRPADGAFSRLEIRDHSRDICEYVVTAMVEAVYETEHFDRSRGVMVETRSTFQGQALVKRFGPSPF